jgi:hypothetical protein
MANTASWAMWHIFGIIFCDQMDGTELDLFRNTPVRIMPEVRVSQTSKVQDSIVMGISGEHRDRNDFGIVPVYRNSPPSWLAPSEAVRSHPRGSHGRSELRQQDLLTF